MRVPDLDEKGSNLSGFISLRFLCCTQTLTPKGLQSEDAGQLAEKLKSLNLEPSEVQIMQWRGVNNSLPSLTPLSAA